MKLIIRIPPYMILSQAKDIIDLLRVKQLKICFAESCTGGLLASTIVSISGASDVFKGSAVCYCDQSKINIVNVKSSTLERYFAESSQVATEMALGALDLYKADVAISTTGFLDDNVADKPIELAYTIFVCLSINESGVCNSYNLKINLDKTSSRNQSRNQIVCDCLNFLKGIII